MTEPELSLPAYLEGARDFAGKLPPEYCYRNVQPILLTQPVGNDLNYKSPP
jgi:hypothetical protein